MAAEIASYAADNTRGIAGEQQNLPLDSYTRPVSSFQRVWGHGVRGFWLPMRGGDNSGALADI